MSLLASLYRAPIEAYLRYRLRGDAQRAEELTQAFFVAVIERDIFGAYLSDKAKFRTFVRVCLDRFVTTSHRRDVRMKRGGGAAALSLDERADDTELELAASDESAEAVFDRELKRALLGSSIAKLEERLAASERSHYYHVFSRFDLYDGPGDRPTYATLAGEIGQSVTQVTNHLHAARKELRRIVAESLRELTSSEDEFLEEAKLLGVDPHPP
jgi:DNA-directed RNA polymerase specialized sigma24 family protein